MAYKIIHDPTHRTPLGSVIAQYSYGPVELCPSTAASGREGSQNHLPDYLRSRPFHHESAY